jgi:alpha-1,6-mannosyltransferase
MKIVDVCAFLSPQGGGVKTYVEQKLAIGARLGHEIVIVAPSDQDEVIERGPGARIVTIASPRFPLDRKYWYFDDEPKLHAVLDAERPDFVEASSPWRSASMVARWNPAVPKALVMHADPLSAYAYRWFGKVLSRATIDRRFERYWEHLRELDKAFDLVVCASRELQGRLASGGLAHTALHPMGIEAGLFSPDRRDPELRRQLLALCDLPEDGHLLIAVGRLAAEKRWPMVVDAVVAASRELPLGMVMLGAGSQKKRIQAQIAGNPHIRILAPERDRVKFATLLACADALIHGCEAETFCMAAAEARAAGVPVIVPDAGGAADHAAGGAGIAYRAGNALAASQAIVDLFAGRIAITGEIAAPVTMEEHFVRLFADYARVAARTAVAA